MNGTIIYLLGHYGVGKLTIAKAICAQTGARLFDNHLVNNVIFSLIRQNGRTGLPDRVWDLIWIIREQAVTAIEELAPPEASFVLTNALMEGDAMDHAAYEQIVALAAARDGLFVPVVLSASDAAHAERIPTPERDAYHKATDVAAALHKRRTRQILNVDHPNRLDLDTTDLPPEAAASIIIDHAERLR